MIGQTISHYKILEKLGEGGMGVVYKAEDTKLDRLVALKFLPKQFSINEEEKQRFIHEAKAAAALDHNNICAVYEIDKTADGQMFIAMAYYVGETLKEMIEKGPLKLNEAIDITIQIAKGLQEAHQNEITHRDIKSANIIVTKRNEVKILDFGLAKLRGVTKLTKEGTTLGTVAYMSPEQATGGEADHKSDIWSLGVMLYEMITGQLPFKGEYEQAIMYAIMNEKPEPVTSLRSGVSLELEKIIQKTLSKDMTERYQNIEDLTVDLKRLKKSMLKSESQSKPAIQKKSRRRIKFLIISGFVFLIIIIIAGYFIFKKKPQLEKPSTQKTSEIKKITEIQWKNSIAVLPFTNISADTDQEYFCDGITEDIITKLTYIKDLKVISRTSIMKYKNTEKSIKDIGKELAVENILEGSVRKEKNRIRITAQLIRVTDDAHLWAKHYDRNLESIFEVQDEVSKAIARILEVTLTPETIKTLKANQSQNMEAYQYYLKGIHIFNNKYINDFTLNQEDFSSAVRMLEKALEIDPNYISAYIGLVWFCSNHYFLKGNKSAFNMALKLSEKIKELAPDSAEGYESMGAVSLMKEKYDQAYEYQKKAISKAPNSARLNYTSGVFFSMVGIYHRAIKYCTRAMELDPLFFWPYATTIRSLIYSGNYHRAEYYLKKAVEIYPDHPLIIRFYCRLTLRTTRYAEAEQWINRLQKLYPKDRTLERWKMILYAARGEREKPLALKYQSTDAFAILGLKDEALAIIQENQNKDKYLYTYLYLINNPHYNNLRDDPRFQEIVKKAKALYDAGLIKYGDL